MSRGSLGDLLQVVVGIPITTQSGGGGISKGQPVEGCSNTERGDSC